MSDFAKQFVRDVLAEDAAREARIRADERVKAHREIADLVDAEWAGESGYAHDIAAAIRARGDK